MCLSIEVNFPDRVLSHGEHAGFQWVVVHNTLGYRCGYVRIPVGHPWHGQDYNDIPAEVHGGLTFAEMDLPCDKPGPDDAYWIGFDCAHCDDLPDPNLPSRLAFSLFGGIGDHIWTQSEVEDECRHLCEQAAQTARRHALV